MNYLMITNQPEIAARISANHSVTPMIDLERMGKKERQAGVNAWMSDHELNDVSLVKKAIGDRKLVVRVNPLHDNSKEEINAVVGEGADSVMLPMFRNLSTVVQFMECLAGRAEPFLLCETIESLESIPQLLCIKELRNFHIGLNDLHLDLGLQFLFEPIAKGLIDPYARVFSEAGVEFGIGGIARLGQGLISPELILSEHVRLGSSRVILSQAFHGNALTLIDLDKNMDFGSELSKLSSVHYRLSSASKKQLEENRKRFVKSVEKAKKQIGI